MDSTDGQLVRGSDDNRGSIPFQLVCYSVGHLCFCVGRAVVDRIYYDPVLLQGVSQDLLELRHKQFIVWPTETNRALKAAWYQKWSVHRRLRPEEFGGRLQVCPLN